MTTLVLVCGFPGDILSKATAQLEKRYRNKCIHFTSAASQKTAIENGIVYDNNFIDNLKQALIQQGVILEDRGEPEYREIIGAFRKPKDPKYLYDVIGEWCYPVELKGKEVRGYNDLVGEIDKVISYIGNMKSSVGREIAEPHKTPLLLPTKHFVCKGALTELLDQVRNDCASNQQTVINFRKKWKKKAPQAGKHRSEQYFTDIKNKYFKPADKNEQHGWANLEGEDWNSVRKFIEGHYRVGIKYYSGFHYDVVDGTHKNIHPNNQVRQ